VVAALNRAWERGDLEALKLAPGAPTARVIRQGGGA
jgi:hypothetical protein